MKLPLKHYHFCLLILAGISLLLNSNAYSQNSISGTVTDDSGELISGASVKVEGGTIGTTTDLDGIFSLKDLPNGKVKLVFSYVGYSSQGVEYDLNGDLSGVKITLEKGVELEQMVLVGDRAKPRTAFNAPVPIDNISLSGVREVATPSLDMQLSKVVPSYTSTQTFVADATAFHNPVGLRGLFQSRVLVLVNGKRKNHSAFIDAMEGPGRSEVGVDMNSIASSAIERVEILRDGAAAQYGSDAMSGVINIVLKKSTKPYIKAQYGITQMGDGQTRMLSTGFGKSTANMYANFSVAYSKQELTNRAGDVDPYLEYDIFETNFGNFYLKGYREKLAEEIAKLGGDTSENKEQAIKNVKEFYTKDGKFDETKITDDGKDMFKKNPKAGFKVGLPNQQTGNFVFNFGYTLDKPSQTKLYSFGTYMYRSGSAPQYARTRYWKDNIMRAFDNAYRDQYYFHPMMTPGISDKTITLGLSSTYNNWNIDLSSTYGGNRVDYNIVDSYNIGLETPSGKEEISPTNFYIGANEFNHVVNNFLLSRVFEDVIGMSSISVSMGMEQRFEEYLSEKGEKKSYIASGSESYRGIMLDFNKKRSNFGVFAESTLDITDDFLIGFAGRYENYSDFGNNFSWKANTRYKPIDEISFRGSFSTGFKAPTLHQKYYQAGTTLILDGQLTDVFSLNTEHMFLERIGIPRLNPEKSMNVSVGAGFKVPDVFTLTIDGYMIDIDDRIVFSNTIRSKAVKDGTDLKRYLEEYDLASAQFFLNALHTRTFGVDLVMSMNKKKLPIGNIYGRLGFNFNRTRIVKEKLPEVIENSENKMEFFSLSDRSRIETSVPNFKGNISLTYELSPLSFTVDANYVGPVSWDYPKDRDKFDYTMSQKVFFDLNIDWELIDNLNLSVGVVNVLDTYPDELKKDDRYSLAGRLKYTNNTGQANIMGRQFLAGLKYSL
ncbi:TonB-dependent receptor [Ichthyobacterium seriolicida]|uniref:TonB-dependent receptor n=1 Tax=Ichthyobacterium seriolicida TaxID=242600 RepID=A0A1J1E2G5_9FLAO|nr:TonB-dependent receptor [Ichthyobacterium seriolicida]BAV94228.1 TonB-dependent receptor [Ichthyobacterium seriolicida]